MEKVRRLLNGAWFKEGFFLLTGISFCSIIAGHRLPSILAAGVLAWGCLVLLWRIIHWKEEKRTPFIVGCVLFLGSYALSSVMNMSYGVTGNIKAFMWMAFELLLLYGARQGGEWKEVKRDLKCFGAAVILYTAVQALVSLGMLIAAYQGVSPSGIYIGVWEGRLWGSYTDPNYGAMLTIVSMIFSIAALLLNWCESKLRLMLYINLVIQYLYLVFSYSRTGLICMLFALALIFVYWCLSAKRSPVKMVVFGIIIIMLGMSGDVFRGAYNTLYADVEFQEPFIKVQEARAAAAAAVQNENNDNAVNQSLDDTENAENTGDIENTDNSDPLRREDELSEDISNGRFGIWKDGVRVWKSSPVYGISYRNISAYIKQNMPDSFLLDRQNALNTFHNVVIDVLVSQGLLGIIILLAMIIGMLRRGVSLLFKLDGEQKGAAVFLGICILTICAGAMFLTDIFYINSPTAIVFWCCLGWLMKMMPEAVHKGSK